MLFLLFSNLISNHLVLFLVRKKVLDHLKLSGCELRNGTEELDQAVQFLHDYG